MKLIISYLIIALFAIFLSIILGIKYPESYIRHFCLGIAFIAIFLLYYTIYKKLKEKVS